MYSSNCIYGIKKWSLFYFYSDVVMAQWILLDTHGYF